MDSPSPPSPEPRDQAGSGAAAGMEEHEAAAAAAVIDDGGGSEGRATTPKAESQEQEEPGAPAEEQEASPVSSHSSDEEEQEPASAAPGPQPPQRGRRQQEKGQLSASQALLRDPLARLPQAGAAVVLDRCLAFLQRAMDGAEAGLVGCEQVEGLFMLQPSLTDVRRLQRRVLMGK